ncbi:hypothetical protein GCM10027451_33160 [Geodermatophilus aquaeductus]
MNTPLSRRHRVAGALVGSAVGDALGAPFELGPPHAFSSRFPALTGRPARERLSSARCGGLGQRHPCAGRHRGAGRALLAAGPGVGAKGDHPDSQWAAMRAASRTTTEEATVEAIVAAVMRGRDG